MKKAAVVILNWNGQALLEQFLPSVVANTPQEVADIIVADNGSSDQSVEWMERRFPEISLIRLDRNYGFAGGYNRAIRQINHPYTILLNSDIEVTEGWLDAPIKALETDRNIVAVQPKIRSYRQKERFEYAGAAGGFIDRYGYPYCRGRVLHIVEQDNGQYDTPADLLWATGACLFIRTDIYKAAGGLDDVFFAHQEEIDLCWRLRSRGYRILCTPQSVVYHVGGATLHTESPRKTFLNFRNNLLMLYKNLPEKELKRVMRVRFWLDYIAAAKFLLSGHFANAKAVYEARRDFHLQLPAYASKRAENLAHTVLSDIPEIRKGSLIAAFYLHGKTSFLQLNKGHVQNID